METITFNPETLKKYSVGQLKSALKNATGEKRKFIIEILEKRNCLDIPYSSGDIEATEKKEGIKPEPQKKETKKTKPETQKPSEDKKPKEKKENASDVKKPLKKEVDSAKVLEDLERASSNKGKHCEFFCTKTKEQATGTIIGVRLDKRNNFIQYRIRIDSEDPKTAPIFGKGIDSEDLKISE